MQINVSFSYLDKTISVKCKDDDDIKEIYKKFVSSLRDKSDITHYIYLYNNNKLENTGKIKDDKYIGGGKSNINIMVQKKNRFIKCPRCICNDCIINLDNYLVSFYGCKYNHIDSRVYDDYIYSQKINNSELRCSSEGCPNTQQNYIFGFYKCLNCTKLLQASIYYCKDHNISHETEFGEHTRVKYDLKHYYCADHFKVFKKYCFTCKRNLCDDCKNEKKCKIQNYESMTPNLDKLKNSLKTLEDNINRLKLVIQRIKYQLDGALRIFKRYDYIAKDIIGKFELFNNQLKNYRILKSLHNLDKTNIKMNDDLNKIIKETNTINKINLIIKVYEEKEKNKQRNTNDNFDFSEDNDDDWLKKKKKKMQKHV